MPRDVCGGRKDLLAGVTFNINTSSGLLKRHILNNIVMSFVEYKRLIRTTAVFYSKDKDLIEFDPS